MLPVPLPPTYRCASFLVGHACAKLTWLLLLWPSGDPPSLQVWLLPRPCGTVCVRESRGSLAAAPHSGGPDEWGGRLKWSTMSYELFCGACISGLCAPLFPCTFFFERRGPCFPPETRLLLSWPKEMFDVTTVIWAGVFGLRHPGIFTFLVNHRAQSSVFVLTGEVIFHNSLKPTSTDYLIERHRKVK